MAGLLGLLLVHATLGWLYMAATPPFDWPDEPAHFSYVRRLAAGEGLGVVDDSSWSPARLEELKRRHFAGVRATDPVILTFRYEDHQPPFYYALAALVYDLAPHLEAVRLVNLIASGAAVLVVFLAARRFFPDAPAVAWGAALFAALLPMRCFMAVSIGNGVAAELLFALFVLAVARRAGPVTIGLLVGAGLWVHTSLLLALPVYGARLLLQRRRHGVVRPLATASLVALLVWSPWVARTVELYGWSDPLALGAGALGSDAAVTDAFGEPRPGLAFTGPHGPGRFARLLFASFWGVFGWMEMSFGPSVQLLFALLSAVPAVGLVLAASDALRRPRRSGGRAKLLAWLAAAPAAALAALLVYSLRDFQPQGRYLLLVSTPLFLLHGVGVQRALGRWTPLGLGLGSLALLAVNLHGALHVVPWYLSR